VLEVLFQRLEAAADLVLSNWAAISRFNEQVRR
jgi:hypothetical protein